MILFRYALKYFGHHPSIFENDARDVAKKKKVDVPPVTELDIVESCFSLLKCNPDFFRKKWNWSVFLSNFLNSQDNKVKW